MGSDDIIIFALLTLGVIVFLVYQRAEHKRCVQAQEKHLEMLHVLNAERRQRAREEALAKRLEERGF